MPSVWRKSRSMTSEGAPPAMAYPSTSSTRWCLEILSGFWYLKIGRDLFTPQLGCKSTKSQQVGRMLQVGGYICSDPMVLRWIFVAHILAQLQHVCKRHGPSLPGSHWGGRVLGHASRVSSRWGYPKMDGL